MTLTEKVRDLLDAEALLAWYRYDFLRAIECRVLADILRSGEGKAQAIVELQNGARIGRDIYGHYTDAVEQRDIKSITYKIVPADCGETFD